MNKIGCSHGVHAAGGVNREVVTTATAFVFLPTRCGRAACRRVFIGAGSLCERCDRKRLAENAKRALAAGNREALGLPPARKPRKPYVLSPAGLASMRQKAAWRREARA